ncbi:acyltransferase LovD [Echria macrotheca]|uniref:Acyltransferase LovD n=1 Tax=Echria macrotheca TaxID=438768 RepID=A0AAJ0BKZ4_9PEZI|nr:acyltransferase LovD [Echria macrotheca]
MEKLDAILAKYVATDEDTTDKLLGAVFIVCDSQKILYQGSAGRTDLSPSSPPFTIDTWTWAASMSKVVTITGVMSLVEQGILNLDADMRPVVPELGKLPILRGFDDDGQPILEENKDPITLRHLLTHGAGIGTDLADPDLQRWSRAVGRTATCTDYTLEGWSVPLRFPPGQGWYYGGGTEFAGAAVERITGRRLDQVMADAVLGPLDMADTTFFRDAPEIRSRVAGRTAPCALRDPQTRALSSVLPELAPVPSDPEILSLGSGLYTTAADHIKVLRGLLRSSGGLGGGGLLKKETVDEMFRPQLSEAQRAVLQSVTGAFHDAMVPEFEADMPLDHGMAGVINLRDAPGKRRRGSMMWQGMANGHWWVDRETGIAATLFVSVMPLPDPVVVRLYDELERAVYGDLLRTG